MGDATPSLQRLGEPVPECAAELWLLIHPELRDTMRVKVVYKLLQAELGKVLMQR